MTSQDPAHSVLNRKEVATKIYKYIEKKALDAYNSGEDEFYIGQNMIVNELGFDMSPENTFAFMDTNGGEEYDICFFDESVANFIYKVARVLMKHHREKIDRIDMHEDLLRIYFIE